MPITSLLTSQIYSGSTSQESLQLYYELSFPYAQQETLYKRAFNLWSFIKFTASPMTPCSVDVRIQEDSPRSQPCIVGRSSIHIFL